MVAAGKLNQRVSIQQKTITRNPANGEEGVAWSLVATVWAEAIPVRGNAFFAANQQQHTVDVRFRIRERADLAIDMRLVWNGRHYDITAIIPGTDKYVGLLEIMAINGVRDGR